MMQISAMVDPVACRLMSRDTRDVRSPSTSSGASFMRRTMVTIRLGDSDTSSCHAAAIVILLSPSGHFEFATSASTALSPFFRLT